MANGSLDLTTLLPPRYRDKTIDTLLKNLTNRHLAKSDTVSLFGFVGDQLKLQPGEVQVRETSLERQINQLIPFIYAEHSTEKHIFSWADLVQKLVALGVDYKTINDWLSTKSYNFVPPIDLDKFCNFQEYYWIGKWFLKNQDYTYGELGMASASQYHMPAFARWGNPTFDPEYYVIQRGAATVYWHPIAPQPTFPDPYSWSDWSYTNLWVHRDDAVRYLEAHGGKIGFEDLIQATRPIIEYSCYVGLNGCSSATGVPTDLGTFSLPQKTRKNQLPPFDLYHYDGSHAGRVSSIFYYKEGQEYPIDSVVGRRLAVDSNNDFIFAHSLVNEKDNSLYFYKMWDPTYQSGSEGDGHPASTFTMKTIWRAGPDIGVNYSKYDTTGTIINRDKFVNFKNYFWVGVDQDAPAYNPTGLPEYYVIETGGTSDWSKYNRWVHVSELKRSELKHYVQATRPIIEYNLSLEDELLGTKTIKGQLPKFKHYIHNQVTGGYSQVISLNDYNNNDAYLTGHLFARLADLPSEVQATVSSNLDILETNCFDFNGEKYMQGLCTGAYYPATDMAVVYGYKSRLVGFEGEGNGSLTIVGTDNNGYPEIITFTYDAASGKFKVRGSVTAAAPDLTPDTPYTVKGCTLHIDVGTVPFQDGDKFAIEILSYIFKKKNLYVNVDGVYRTVTSPEEIYNELQSATIVTADPTKNDGIWQVPPQLEWNVQNETRSEIKQGDLYFHLSSIIGAQPWLIGSPTGNNDWRMLITRDVGLGGTIKQFDGDLALLVSMLLQEGITTSTLIDFAKESYADLTTAIRMFVEEKIPDMLNEGKFIPPTTGDSISPIVVDAFKDYFFARSPVVTESVSPVDDVISTPFYDSTSSLFNLVATLPYLGLGEKVEPKKLFDYELNLPMLVHHDGHQSQLVGYPVDLAKKIVLKEFERSPGQVSAGIISGFNYPQKPYRGQFWFKTGSGQLFIYNTVSDDGSFPENSPYGSYAYDRSTGKIWQNDGNDLGAVWVYLGDDESFTSLPWVEVKLDLILQNLELAIETELYNQCPALTQRLDSSALVSDSHYNPLMKSEFEKFGVVYGVTDVYATTFDPANGFTWNYGGVIIPGCVNIHSAWQDAYLEVYGTVRPDLFPWIAAGYDDEPSFIVDCVAAGLLPSGTVSFSTSMWPLISTFVKDCRQANGKITRLSIHVQTGTLIPPYKANEAESLLSSPPGSAMNMFAFGSNGPVERFWKKTLDFLYSQQKAFFKIDPLTYTRETWGVKHLEAGEYTLNPQLGRKESSTDFTLHGKLLQDTAQPSWITAELSDEAPLYEYTYTFTCVSREDGIFKLVISNDRWGHVSHEAAEEVAAAIGLDHPPTTSQPIFLSLNEGTLFDTDLHYTDNHVDVVISPSLRGFFWGDTFTVKVDSEGSVTTSLSPQVYSRFEGFNQIYVQYNRLYGEDSAISINSSLLHDWKVKLGYRFSGMVNTDTLYLQSQDTTVDDSAYKVFLKENKFYNSSWINALRVQLVKRGSTELYKGSNVPKAGASGVPGDDWVFRIDNYNPKRPNISWYEYDDSGSYQTFTALDGDRTVFPWKRYTDRTGVRSHSAPFLVTGLQNLITFMFGFADKLESDGWRFNDPNDPILDPSTGRPLSFQLLIEQFIVQQFSGVDAGSAFLFNPFHRKVWYNSPRGVVSSLYNVIGLETETVCAVLDENRKQLSRKDLRVFRQDELTELVFDRPVFTLHLLTSEYEHVILFENYSIDTLLLYDAFLGQRTSRVFVRGEKQANFTGRIDFGGHFLLGDQMKKNLENSVSGIIKLYDTNSGDVDESALSRARALLGFSKKDYFKNRGTTDASEFRFWQGMIANKGTNLSVDAFINSASYQDAKLDEYWAYKLAEYGDSRPIVKAELNVQPDDCTGERTNYLFVEHDDELVSDGSTDGMILIYPNDENRWHSYSDLNTIKYLEADVIAEMLLTPAAVGDCHVIYDGSGKPVRADCFELWDPNYIEHSDGYDMIAYDENPIDASIQQVYREEGDYIEGSSPARYGAPRFARVNHSTIKILDQTLVGRTLKVVAFGPAEKKYSPNKLVNYVDHTMVKDDLIWWDPARGVHHPAASASIDVDGDADPALYTNTFCEYKNGNLGKLKAWGSEQVGTVWWNTENLFWSPYSDDHIHPDVHGRLARWGSLSQMSKINVYEWVKSSIPPESAPRGESMTGEPAVSSYVKRTRTWWQRPVAWKFSANPDMTPRSFLTYQPAEIKLSLSNGGGRVVLKEGDLESLGIKLGSKIAGAVYTGSTFTDENLSSIFGTAKISSEPYIVVGTLGGFDDGVTFTSSVVSSPGVTTDINALKFRDNYLGQYVLSGSGTTLTLTHLSSGENQQIVVSDVVGTVGSQVSYNFDKLGVQLNFMLSVDSSTLGASAALRASSMVSSLGSSSAQIFLRSAVDVISTIPFIYQGTTYQNLGGSSTVGWIAWNDPSSNPNTGVKPPLNQYEPMSGDWVKVGSFLHPLADEIKLRTADPWTWFDGQDFTPYKSSWNSWSEIKPTVVERRYCLTSADTPSTFNSSMVFSQSENYLKKHARVFINEKKISSSRWVIEAVGSQHMIKITDGLLNQGDVVRVFIDGYVPSQDELKFDPAVKDDDPFKLTQYKRDFPHVVEILRDQNDNPTVTNYYYWVKNKTVAAKHGRISIKAVEQALKTHDGLFCTPQLLKFYNQLDGRPNRYSLLSVRKLGLEVRAVDRFMLRITENSTLRDRDLNISLKPVHEEWILLRPGQLQRIPKQLWDTLTNTLVGQTQLGQDIPFSTYYLYDQKNNSTVEYGMNSGQVMADTADVISTVKYTILNTQVDKYVNGKLVPDYISYEGFDVDQLDTYFATGDSIRKIMTDLWRFAKPAQVNEIFFAALHDAAAKSQEMSSFFKTSFISLSDVRTIKVTG